MSVDDLKDAPGVLASVPSIPSTQNAPDSIIYEYALRPDFREKPLHEVFGVIFDLPPRAYSPTEKRTFVAAKITKCFFERGDLRGLDFTSAKITDTSFAGANLSGVSFERAVLTRVSFAGANLKGAVFLNSTIATDVLFPLDNTGDPLNIVSVSSGPTGLLAEIESAAPDLFYDLEKISRRQAAIIEIPDKDDIETEEEIKTEEDDIETEEEAPQEAPLEKDNAFIIDEDLFG